MKYNFKALVASVFCYGALMSANAQINLLSNDVIFRSSTNANNTTWHNGDLHLSGGNYGSSWGWLLCEGGIGCDGPANFGGNVTIWGALNVWNTASKNFLQVHPTDTTKVIRYICIESGEALTIARGTAKTINGNVIINLPEHFGLVTSDEAPLTVLLNPEKVPVLLYTIKKTKSQITVNMKKSDYEDYGDAEFSWQVTGVRDGFENQQVICDIDSTGNVVEAKTLSTKRIAMNEKSKKIMEKRMTVSKNRSVKTKR